MSRWWQIVALELKKLPGLISAMEQTPKTDMNQRLHRSARKLTDLHVKSQENGNGKQRIQITRRYLSSPIT